MWIPGQEDGQQDYQPVRAGDASTSLVSENSVNSDGKATTGVVQGLDAAAAAMKAAAAFRKKNKRKKNKRKRYKKEKAGALTTVPVYTAGAITSEKVMDMDKYCQVHFAFTQNAAAWAAASNEVLVAMMEDAEATRLMYDFLLGAFGS